MFYSTAEFLLQFDYFVYERGLLMKNIHNRSFNALSHYLSPLEVWALSFGCAVGWGAFVMPGTKFLPFAGPYGTAIGMILGAFIMLIIQLKFFFSV